MCNASMTVSHSHNIEKMVFEFSKGGNVPQFDITVGTATTKVKVPDGAGTPIAVRISGTTLEFGEGTFDQCTLLTESICLKGPLGTFRILPNAGGIGISDLRDGKITVVSFDLQGTMLLLSSRISGGDLFLDVQFPDKSVVRGTLTSGSFEQRK